MFYSDYNFFSIFLSVLELTETKLENLLKIYISKIYPIGKKLGTFAKNFTLG